MTTRSPIPEPRRPQMLVEVGPPLSKHPRQRAGGIAVRPNAQVALHLSVRLVGLRKWRFEVGWPIGPRRVPGPRGSWGSVQPSRSCRDAAPNPAPTAVQPWATAPHRLGWSVLVRDPEPLKPRRGSVVRSSGATRVLRVVNTSQTRYKPRWNPSPPTRSLPESAAHARSKLSLSVLEASVGRLPPVPGG